MDNTLESYENNESQYNIYWYLRYLVASAYGNYATKEEKGLRELSKRLGNLIDDNASLETLKNEITKGILRNVSKIYRNDISKRYRQTEDLVERISRKISSIEDVKDFQIAINIACDTTNIQQDIQEFGKAEIISIIDNTFEINNQNYLDPSLAYDALYNVDMKGEEHQLDAQRDTLVKYSIELIENIDYLNRNTKLRILTALAQEYERRAGQSRSATAGGVLETALNYLFDCFNVESIGKPKHLGDLEIDNLVRGPKGSIGFSCKRTLRERFRQSLQRQSEIGVDEIWFVALMIADISKDKVKDIGNNGGRIYVPRDSYIWKKYQDDLEVENALFPADDFIEDIINFTGLSV